jgi:hypothetical protein
VSYGERRVAEDAETFRVKLVQTKPDGTESVSYAGPYGTLGAARNRLSHKRNEQERWWAHREGYTYALSIQRTVARWEDVE